MDNYVILTIAIIACLIMAGRLGHRQKKKAESKSEEIVLEMFLKNNVEILGRIAYHGGLPQMPKPSMLLIGVSREGLFMCDYKGWSDKVDFRDCLRVERFTVNSKADTIGKSTVLLGPLVPFLFKDTLRHFVSIKHIDRDREENHLVLEIGTEELQRKICSKLFRFRKRYNMNAIQQCSSE